MLDAADEIERLRTAAAFLLDRIDDWAADGLDDTNANDWMGHVEPAMARLRSALPTTEDKGDE
ncbi:MAG: hypothetical protein AAF580_04945 [Pseudomonadota bacterium]